MKTSITIPETGRAVSLADAYSMLRTAYIWEQAGKAVLEMLVRFTGATPIESPEEGGYAVRLQFEADDPEDMAKVLPLVQFDLAGDLGAASSQVDTEAGMLDLFFGPPADLEAEVKKLCGYFAQNRFSIRHLWTDMVDDSLYMLWRSVEPKMRAFASDNKLPVDLSEFEVMDYTSEDTTFGYWGEAIGDSEEETSDAATRLAGYLATLPEVDSVDVQDDPDESASVEIAVMLDYTPPKFPQSREFFELVDAVEAAR